MIQNPSHRSSSLGNPAVAALLIIGLLLVVAPARSDTFCVGTPAELTNALAGAAITGGANQIRVRTGTYAMPNGATYINLFGGDLAILGGWNANCTGRVEDPYATVIDGSGGGSSEWDLRGGSIDISVSRMRFFNVRALQFSDLSYDCDVEGQRFRIDRAIIDGASDLSRVYFTSNCHESELESSLILGGDVGVRVRSTDAADDPPAFRFAHNTILGAQNGAIWVNHLESATGFGEIYNTIAYTGGGFDFYLVKSVVLAFGNTWGSTAFGAGSGLAVGSGNNVTGNPQLQANGRPIEPGSPVINSGSLSLPGGLPPVDLQGGQRVVGSKPDRGAFETAISDLTVVTVTNFGNSGPGTLRQAILSANASPGPQTIVFDIPTSCPATIFLQTPLPDITDDGLLFINGSSQPGSSTNTLVNGNNAVLCVRVRGNASFDPTHALRVPAGSNALLWLQGISFGGFTVAPLELFGGSGHIVHGNRFGGDGQGGNPPGNGIGVWLDEGASNVQLGGTFSPGYRNIIQNNDLIGVFIDGSTGTDVGNNYIGTNLDGSAAAPNGVGVLVSFASGTTIRNNVISGNTNDGVALTGDGTFETTVVGNRIGVKRAGAGGLEALGNGGAGLRVLGGHDNRIGGSGRLAGNRIAYNGDGGVWIEEGRRNRISRNAIFGNVGLGIDLASQGVNPNNDDSGILPVDYANRGLNYPVLTAASGDGLISVITGSLSTTPGTYRVEFFANTGRSCDPSGHGEGAILIGSTMVNIPVPNPGPPQGTAAISATLTSTVNLTGKLITATATDADGNTSEFSACRTYVSSDLIFADDFEG